ncbi:MAG TPA: hypothetical protein VK513_06045, partial [Terriglobales bacterium]|nr:hypothetical protein [Terriglobales bacterium]
MSVPPRAGTIIAPETEAEETRSGSGTKYRFRWGMSLENGRSADATIVGSADSASKPLGGREAGASRCPFAHASPV